VLVPHHVSVRSRRLDDPVWVILIFSALAVAVTWPLALHLGDSIPSDVGDPLLNAWILGWDAERLRHGLKGLWDAPIFYPYQHTLAFSEHLLGIAVFVAPIFWLSGNPLIAYNVAFVLSFVLAGVGMFLLVRELTGSSEAAWIAGLIFAFSPARFGHISHLQVLMSGWMPLSLWALHRFLKSRSALSLAAFIVFALAQCLSNNYFIYFLALPTAIVALHGLYRAPAAERPRLLAGLAIAAGVIVAALTPIAVMYLRVRREFGFRRTVEDATSFGADLATYFHGNDGVRPPLSLWRHLPFASKPAGPEGELFVGMIALTLAAIGIVLGCRRWRSSDFRNARVYGAIAAIALLLSCGIEPTAWSVHLPIGGLYQLLFNLLPGFDGIRVPARLAVVVLLAAAVLAGIGVSALLRDRRPAIAWALTGVLAVTILLEGYAAPLPLAFVGRGGRPDRSAYNWIRDHAPGPILEMPDGDLAPLLQPFGYEYQTLFHGQPIVNGSSGYSSPLDDFITGDSSPFYDFDGIADALRLLRGVGVKTIVVHPKAYLDPEIATATLRALSADSQITERVPFLDMDIFRLKPFDGKEDPDQRSGRDQREIAGQEVKEIPREGFVATASRSPDRLALAFDRNIDTRWLTGARQQGGEFIELAFARPYDVARVRLLTSDRSVGDYPRHLVIEATDDEGTTSRLYDGPVVFQLAVGLVRDPMEGPIDVWLPQNRTRRLRLVQTGTTRQWFWAIDELSVWEPAN
jgi:hypothetical protein